MNGFSLSRAARTDPADPAPTKRETRKKLDAEEQWVHLVDFKFSELISISLGLSQ